MVQVAMETEKLVGLVVLVKTVGYRGLTKLLLMTFWLTEALTVRPVGRAYKYRKSSINVIMVYTVRLNQTTFNHIVCTSHVQ